MPYNLESPRYIPLTHHGLDGAVLLLDSQAPLKDLHACVELRVRLATGTAHLLMQEACDMNRVIEKRLWEGI
jgi:hypothetical protein